MRLAAGRLGRGGGSELLHQGHDPRRRLCALLQPVVRTVEVNPVHAEFARDWVGRSDVADRVEVFTGDGREVLPTFDAESADAAFIDADKSGYQFYLRQCLRILRPGGLIMVDNAFAFGQILDMDVEDESVEALRAFNLSMAGTKGLRSIIVPLGDGCWVGVKPRAGE